MREVSRFLGSELYAPTIRASVDHRPSLRGSAKRERERARQREKILSRIALRARREKSNLHSLVTSGRQAHRKPLIVNFTRQCVMYNAAATAADILCNSIFHDLVF